MANHNISDDVLNSASAADYFLRSDRRIMLGMRATLELLGLPTPDYALRRKPGPSPAKSVAAAYLMDNPAKLATNVAERKPNATPEAIMSARYRSGHYA